ncbi:lytic murein transglycosylase B [Pseudorhodoferax sp.]|uniref:lytic murein transglycosylase B n=1 Tax=Pseudorhodoferax sp. TaxID=1993553 RepID=UPI0039E39C8F
MNRLLRCSLALFALPLIALPAPAQTPKKRPAAAAAAASAPGPLYATRPEVLLAADDIASRRDLDREWVRQAIGQARLLPQVQRLMAPAPRGTPKNWRVYRSRFIDPARIRAGVRFWQQHREALARAERTYGVPAEIIVGILGVETIYGQQTGSFPAIDALVTLAFDFPKAHPRAAERAAFFLGELEQLLSLSDRSGTDPRAWRGSFAGAMGLPQFMPSSWVRYAVDFDGDGRVDLFGSAEDAIGSVANYFRAFGWQTGMPAFYPVALDPQADMDTLLAPDILPTFGAERFTALGARLDGAALQHAGPLALVELQNGGDAPQYVAGTENFYVITRYNWSSYYAMAVLELGQAVKAALDRPSGA